MSYEYSTPGTEQEFKPPKSNGKRNCCLFAVGGCGCLTVVLAIIIGVSMFLVFNSKSGFRGLMETTFNSTIINNALERYCRENGEYPPAYSVDENGQPLHSWRVLILPWLTTAQHPFDNEGIQTQNLQELYDNIRLDEPWDSEHNRQFASQMPRCYLNATLKEEGKTSFQMIVGPKCISDGSGSRTANEVQFQRRVVIIEANPSVEWMKPQDLQYSDLEANGFVEHGGAKAGVICPHSIMTMPFGLAVIAGAEPGVYSNDARFAKGGQQRFQTNGNSMLTLEQIRKQALFDNEIEKAVQPEQDSQLPNADDDIEDIDETDA